MAHRSRLHNSGYDHHYDANPNTFSNPSRRQEAPFTGRSGPTRSSSRPTNDSIRPSVRFAEPIKSDNDRHLSASRHRSSTKSAQSSHSTPHQPTSSRSSTSSYISRSRTSRSDYITPSTSNSHFNRTNYSSRPSHDYHDSLYEKSNYRMIKDGGWSSKKEFMECHGLSIHNHEDFDEARELLNEYRRLDAQYDSPKGHTRSSRGQLEYYECDEDCINNAGDDGWIGSSRNDESENDGFRRDGSGRDAGYEDHGSRTSYRGTWDDTISPRSDEDAINDNNSEDEHYRHKNIYLHDTSYNTYPSGDHDSRRNHNAYPFSPGHRDSAYTRRDDGFATSSYNNRPEPSSPSRARECTYDRYGDSYPNNPSTSFTSSPSSLSLQNRQYTYDTHSDTANDDSINTYSDDGLINSDFVSDDASDTSSYDDTGCNEADSRNSGSHYCGRDDTSGHGSGDEQSVGRWDDDDVYDDSDEDDF
ncbi:hypothetical protein K458DRAFT_426174 [Lentithecium fluviatile CBS 122367]|uniref:Uncharacterized protein n=1 Tax=Lentithecium fluviatile CBS 122367 TaxID=1168545 RepID=A0A6G1JKP6_9PLEO|nr:hypothetical protein K458DRAFT_426174 [Lentithecium fluviatile CBS 122367]